MSAFLFTRSGGIWNTVPVSYAEMADLDAKTKKALNAEEGGTWAPSSVITIGGSGLTMTGPFIADGTFLVTSGGRIENGLIVTGFADLQNDAQVSGTFEVVGGTTLGGGLDLTGNLFVHDTGASIVLVEPTAQFEKIVTFNDTVFFTGATDFAGANEFSGPTTITTNALACNAGAVIHGGSLNMGVGGWVSENHTTGTDADMALDPADFTAVYWANFPAFTATRICTLSAAARDGATVWLRCDQSTYRVQVVDGGSSTLISTIGSSSGYYMWAVFKKFGMLWREMAYGERAP